MASAAPIVSDSFNDGGRTNGSDLLDVAWFENNAGVATTVNSSQAGGNITGNSVHLDGGGTFRFLAASFPDTTLGTPGSGTETLRLTFDFRVMAPTVTATGTLAAPTGAGNFRFSLSNSNGTLPTADGSTNSANNFGYRGLVATGTTTAAAVSIAQEYGGNGDVLSGNDVNGTLGAATSSGTLGISTTDVFGGLLSITNMGAGSIQITSSIFDASGTLLTTASRTDSGAIRNSGDANSEPGTDQYFTTFNVVAFGGSPTDQNFRIDNVLIEAVPEPGTWFAGLLVSVPAVLLAARRRTKIARKVSGSR